MKRVIIISAAIILTAALSGWAERKKPKSMENGSVGAGMYAKIPMESDGIVRLSYIEVHPQYLDAYKSIAAEVGEISLRTEPGVLTMYAVAQKDNPCLITILETYASQKAYQSHIASPHFQKYKQASLPMVKSLELCDQVPLNSASKIINTIE